MTVVHIQTFRRTTGAATVAGMTNTTPLGADLQLRGSAGAVRARIHWPVPASTAPTLLVFFPGWTVTDGERAGMAESEVLCRHLCARPGLVVIAAPCRNASEATATAEWAAEHANELGADASTLALGGDGLGADLADTVARHASDTGWPLIDRLVLIDPTTSTQPDTTGVVAVHRSIGLDVADLAVAVRRALDRPR